MKKINIVLIACVIIIGTALRFYQLGSIPEGLHRDEAFLGYNAYSILKTGKDISGHILPLHLQSYLYSPAGYSYFSIPFISVFGLNAFSVRFASALFGALTIILTYLLALKLLNRVNIALTASFLLAISPWHINLSRTATENTIVVFFISLGILFYLHWLKHTSLPTLGLSFLSFAVTFTLYQGPRAFLPMFVPYLIYVLGIPKKHVAMVSSLFFITILLPLVIILISPQLSLRIKTVSILASTQTQLLLDEQIREDGVTSSHKFMTRIFHNKVAGYSAQFLDNYFSHFSYSFLFTDKGLPDRYRVPGAGLLYIFELPLLLFGIIYLLKNARQTAYLLLGWIIIAPIGSSLTFDDIPNLQRTLLIFPSLSVVIASGVIGLTEITYRSRVREMVLTTIKIVLITVAIYNVLFYLHQYFVHLLIHKPWYRHEGYQQMITEVNKLLPKYKSAIITTRESSPTIFFLFFNKYDPKTFQTETQSVRDKDLDRVSFYKFQFSQDECPLRLEVKTDAQTAVTRNYFIGLPDTLYVNSGTCSTPRDYAKELKVIQRRDNSTIFKIATP